MTDGLTRFVASGFGLGRSPFVPGTVGTLAGIPLAWLISLATPLIQIVILLTLMPVGAAVCSAAERVDGGHDPAWVVFDEMVGFCFAVTLLPPDPFAYLAAFCLFRAFDILKPPPVSWLDRGVPGGWGILLDDVAAGLMARAVLELLLLAGLL